LRHERNDIEGSLAMTHGILSMGGESESNLYAQGETMKKTKKKQSKYIELIPEINKLIKKIHWAQLRNNVVISLVLSILISAFIYTSFMK
jgi:preprotein translocase subunit SecE